MTDYNEVIDMEEDGKGTFKASQTPEKRPKTSKVPYNRIPFPEGRISKFYQFLGGFIVGLSAVERFFEVMRKYPRR